MRSGLRRSEPMSPPPPKFRSFDDIERWADDHEAKHLRERDERSHELTAAVSGATAHIDRVAAKQNAELAAQTKALEEQKASLVSVDTKLNAIGNLSTATVEELRLAREERIKRTAADEEKARIKAEAKLEAELAETVRTARNNRRAVWIPVVLAVIGIITAIVASGASHH